MAVARYDFARHPFMIKIPVYVKKKQITQETHLTDNIRLTIPPTQHIKTCKEYIARNTPNDSCSAVDTIMNTRPIKIGAVFNQRPNHHSSTELFSFSSFWCVPCAVVLILCAQPNNNNMSLMACAMHIYIYIQHARQCGT